MKTLYSSLLIAVVALVGCGSEAGTSGSSSAGKSGGSAKASTTTPAAASTPAATATTPAPAGSGSAAAGAALPKICEDALAKMKTCTYGKMPDGPEKEKAIALLDSGTRTSWASVPAAGLEAMCKTTLDSTEKTCPK